VSNGTSTPTINVTFPLVSIYGDGSDGTTTGVCAITSDTNWVSSPPTTDIQCTNFSVSSSVTLTVPSGTVIRATGTVNIAGTITVQAGAAQGLYQDAANFPYGSVALSSFSLRKILNPGAFGGGDGGYSAAVPGIFGLGGGSIVILAEGAVTVSGTITANGGNGGTDTIVADNYGGGAGGIIILASKTSITTSSGTLTATGGHGGAANSTTGAGGGGGGGLIHLLAPSGQITTGTETVSGGAAGTISTGTGSGYGGGAMGGSGGNGDSTGEYGTTASAGSTGVTLTTTVADPATLFVQ
jgi:hypothetical protein